MSNPRNLPYSRCIAVFLVAICRTALSEEPDDEVGMNARDAAIQYAVTSVNIANLEYQSALMSNQQRSGSFSKETIHRAKEELKQAAVQLSEVMAGKRPIGPGTEQEYWHGVRRAEVCKAEYDTLRLAVNAKKLKGFSTELEILRLKMERAFLRTRMLKPDR